MLRAKGGRKSAHDSVKGAGPGVPDGFAGGQKRREAVNGAKTSRPRHGGRPGRGSVFGYFDRGGFPGVGVLPGGAAGNWVTSGLRSTIISRVEVTFRLLRSGGFAILALRPA